MEDNSYNGWENWDTWDVNLWLNSDKATYKEARRIAGCGRTQHLRELAVHTIPGREGVDFNAVNWEEIEEAFLEE